MPYSTGITARLAVVMALAAALTTGCAAGGSIAGDPTASPSPTTDPSADPTASPTATPTVTSPLVPFTAAEVLAFCPAQKAVHLDLDLDPAAVTDVYVCTTESFEQLGDPQTDPETDPGTDLGTEPGTVPGTEPAERAPIQRASRVTGGTEALLEAYSVPNEPASDGACIALAADPLIVWIATSAGITPVYAPVDGCGQPSSEAAEAYRALELSTLLELPA